MSENSVNGITLGSLSVIQWAYLVLRLWFLIPFPSKKNEDLLEKWLLLELEQDIYKLRLEYLVVPESKEVLETNQPMKKLTWEYVNVAEEPNESIPKGQRWNNLSKKINNYWIITQLYWPKNLFRFFVRCYRQTRTNFLANPINILSTCWHK